MRVLRQNTAVRISVGPFLDVTDAITPETALTVTNCTAELFTDDDDNTAVNRTAITLTASGGTNDMVHITNDTMGMYDLELTAAQTNVVGRAKLIIIDTDVHLPVIEEFMVMPQQAYDSLYGTDMLQVDLTQIGGAAVSTTTAQLGVNVVQISADATAADNLESYCDGTTPIPANATQLSGDATAADNAEAFFDGTGYNGANNTIPTVTNLTNAPSNGDFTAAMKTSLNAATPALSAAGNGAVADAVWDEARAGHATGGTFGEGVSSVQGAVTGNVGGNVAGSVGSVAANGIAAASIATGAITNAKFAAGAIDAAAIADGAIDAATFAAGAINAAAIAADAIGASELAADAVAEIADGVWDEARAGHTTAGSFGQGVASVQSGVTLADDAITAAKFDESTAFPLASADTGATQIARVGADGDTLETISDQIDGAATGVNLATVDTVVDAIKLKTDNLPALPAATGDIPTAAANADAVWDEARAAHTNSGSFGEKVPAAVAVGDITGAMTESYAADGDPPTLQQALYQIMQFLHEKSISGTTLTVRRLDGSTAAMTFTLDDGTDPASLTRAS